MIIDTHVHFLDPTRPGGVPYQDPNVESRLYRTVLPLHFKAITKPHGIKGVVVVEASDRVEDNQWILDIASQEPLIVGFSGNLDMRSNKFEDLLQRFSSNPLFRGIRARSLDPTDYSTDEVIRSAELLEVKDLQLDTPLGYYDFTHLFTMISRVPQLRVVINHIGAGRPINGKPPNPTWIEMMNRIAKYPNVYCKVSAIMQHSEVLPAPTELNFYRPMLDTLWNAFGEDRLMYGSNWPNVEQVGPYSQEVNITKRYFKEKGSKYEDKFFVENSKTAYKWIPR